MSLVILVTLAAPRSSRGDDPGPASGCDVLVDVTHTDDPVAAIQAQLNRWNLFSDENGDRDNDRLHLCIAGRMKLDASMARSRYRPVPGGTSPGPIRSIFSVAPAHDTGPGTGIERGLPVACSERRWCDRHSGNSKELVISFRDLLIEYDRSKRQEGPTALFQLGDGFLTGGRHIKELLVLEGDLTIHVRGDGDGDTTPFTVPRLDSERWIDDPNTLVFLYFDYVTRANTSDLSLKIMRVDNYPTTDHRTVGVLNNQSFSKSLEAGTYLAGLGVGYWQMGVDHPPAPHRLMIRHNTIGLMIGDPVNGCRAAHFAGSAEKVSNDPCNGFRGQLEHEGNSVGIVVFGDRGRIELRATRAEMDRENPNHHIILGAGVNSMTGEICTSDAHAARQRSGSRCLTVEDVHGDQSWPDVIFNGGVVPGDQGNESYDGLLIANEYDGRVTMTGGVHLGGNLVGGTNEHILSYDGNPAGAEIVLESWTSHLHKPRVADSFPGRIYFSGRTFASSDCSKETRGRHHKADRCIDSSGDADYLCWPDAGILTCREAKDWRRRLAGSP
jgi:hypothetical protein